MDSPLDDNSLHVVYFNATCDRLLSRPKFVSRKGVIIFSPDVDLAGLGAAGDVNGLAVIGRTTDNISLTPIPDNAAIHVRGYWFNVAQDFIRVVDTIAVSSAETGVAVPADKQTYSPLRSGASFEAPQDIPPFTTTLHLICPQLLGLQRERHHGRGRVPGSATLRYVRSLVLSTMTVRTSSSTSS